MVQEREPQTAPQMLMAALRDFGLGVIVAVYLIWFTTSKVSATLDTIRLDLSQHMLDTLYFSQRICVNTAKDELQAKACEVKR